MARDEFCEGGKCSSGNTGICGGFYGLTVIGAAVYFITNTSGFWQIVLAILKAFVWPAFVTYKAFTLLGM